MAGLRALAELVLAGTTSVSFGWLMLEFVLIGAESFSDFGSQPASVSKAPHTNNVFFVFIISFHVQIRIQYHFTIN